MSNSELKNCPRCKKRCGKIIYDPELYGAVTAQCTDCGFKVSPAMFTDIVIERWNNFILKSDPAKDIVGFYQTVRVKEQIIDVPIPKGIQAHIIRNFLDNKIFVSDDYQTSDIIINNLKRRLEE